MRLRAGQRLRRNADFRAVREEGRRIDGGCFQLVWRTRPPGASAIPRVGVVASRAAVGGAVQRNFAKRRLREVYRRHQDAVPPGLDLILTARAALLRLGFPELEQKFLAVCGKLPAAPHA
jgi:ribonuclease P protein component